MDLNKILFSFIKTAFGILIILFIAYAAMNLSGIGYDFGYRVFTESAIDNPPGKDVLVQVTDQTSEKELGELLEEKGLVRDARLFYLQLKLSAYKGKIKPGVYTLNTSMNPKDMIVIMAADDPEDTEGTETVQDTEEKEKVQTTEAEQ